MSHFIQSQIPGQNRNKFQYFSDVHTEMYKAYPSKIHRFKINPVAPRLILAGDIGHPSTEIYSDFLKMLSPKYEHIYIISGNHEYYQTPKMKKTHDPTKNWMQTVEDDIRNICDALPNVTYLQNEVCHIPDSNISIFGGTFWTDVKDEEKVKVRYSLVDYREIPGFCMSSGIEKHRESCKKLEEVLVDNPTRDFIVVSHHLPSYSLINEKYIDMRPAINSAYATEIEIAKHPQIKAWVAGHTHTPVQKGKFYVNPIGYPGENMSSDFNMVFIV